MKSSFKKCNLLGEEFYHAERAEEILGEERLDMKRDCPGNSRFPKVL